MNTTDPIDSMSPEAMRATLRDIREAFYPAGDPHAEWSADTLDGAAKALINGGAVPSEWL